MIFDRIFALEKRDEEQRSLKAKLQEQMSKQQLVIQDLKMLLASQNAYIEKLETRLSSYEETTHKMTVPSKDDILKPVVRGKCIRIELSINQAETNFQQN